MKYEIIVRKVVVKTETLPGEWETLDTRPYTAEEWNEGNIAGSYDGLKEIPLKNIKGHTPSRVMEKEVFIDVLNQKVDKLDLTAVIKAINGID